jgi:hypothetical protein
MARCVLSYRCICALTNSCGFGTVIYDLMNIPATIDLPPCTRTYIAIMDVPELTRHIFIMHDNISVGLNHEHTFWSRVIVGTVDTYSTSAI